MQLIRPGARDCVYHGSAVPPVLRRVVVRQDAELFERVGIGQQGCGVRQWIVVVAAVEHVVIGDSPGAVHRNRRILAEAHGAGARHRAGDQQLELQRIAPIQREVYHTPLIDDLLDRAADRYNRPL